MNNITTPNPKKFRQLSIDPHHEELSQLLQAASDAFEYLALQLETSSGNQFIKPAIHDYHRKAKLAKHFADLVDEGGEL